MADIAAQLRTFITENFVMGDRFELTDDRSFLDSGVIDSTSVLELIDFLEETFDIQIADDEMIPENLDTINNVVGFVERKSSGTASA